MDSAIIVLKYRCLKPIQNMCFRNLEQNPPDFKIEHAKPTKKQSLFYRNSAFAFNPILYT